MCFFQIHSDLFLQKYQQNRTTSGKAITHNLAVTSVTQRVTRVQRKISCWASCPENVDKEDKRNNGSMISFNGATEARSRW